MIRYPNARSLIVYFECKFDHRINFLNFLCICFDPFPKTKKHLFRFWKLVLQYASHHLSGVASLLTEVTNYVWVGIVRYLHKTCDDSIIVFICIEIKTWCLEHYSSTIATHGIIVWSSLTWSCYSMTYPRWIQLSTMGDRKWSIRRITIQKLTDCIIHHRQFLSSACSMKWLVSSEKLITLKYDMELSW